MPQQRRLTLGILGAALGALLIFTGAAVLIGHLVQYVETLQWSAYSLLNLLKAPTVNSTLPRSLQSWLHRPESLHGLHAAVVAVLDTVPAFVILIGLGGMILRKALK